MSAGVRLPSVQYPPSGFGAPKDRHGRATRSVGLPEGTEVFSADDHISLSEDIFFERFPESMKARAPRVVHQKGAYSLAVGGKEILPEAFISVLMQYDPLAGAATNNIDDRLAELKSDGVDKELAFPNAMLALMAYPDLEVRELCFRIYNEYIAELQQRSKGWLYGVGLINWWDGKGAQRTLSELKELGLRTFWLPLKPGSDAEGTPIDYSSSSMLPVWESIEEAGLPVSHHIGEGPISAPVEFNGLGVGLTHQMAPFREMFGRYVFTILDRFPGLRVGWFEGGVNWVISAIQDARHVYASYRHMLDRDIEHDPGYYWEQHMAASFMVDPLGLHLIDELGVDRVMWSTDYPHNESTFGYTEDGLIAVVDALGPEAAAKVVSGNIKTYLAIDS
jgi:predicted TIM-barrel fold metal-dependent hydrolase